MRGALVGSGVAGGDRAQADVVGGYGWHDGQVGEGRHAAGLLQCVGNGRGRETGVVAGFCLERAVAGVGLRRLAVVLPAGVRGPDRGAVCAMGRRASD